MIHKNRPRWLLVDSEIHRTLETLSPEAFEAYVRCCGWAGYYGITEFGIRARTIFTRRRWSIERELYAAGLWILDGDVIRIGYPNGKPVIKRIHSGNGNGDARSRRWISPGTRYGVLERDGFACRACGATAADGVQLQIDHRHPVSKGGTNDIDNLQTLCSDCNIGKSDS